MIPSRSAPNLERLATALKRLEAKIRTEDEPIETRIDAAFILNMPHMRNLATRYGDIDLVFTPAGALNNYEQWLKRSLRAQLREGLVVAVADLDDIIASEAAANRPKDQRSLPYLESLRDQLR